MSSTIGLIILAAGASTRMGTPKQLLTHRGQTLVPRAADAALASVCRPVVVVLGAYANQVSFELRELPVRVTMNQQWNEGMSSSIQNGLKTLRDESPEASGVVIMLCDQPFVSAAIINQLVEAHRQTGNSIVASAYGKTRGVPVLFGRKLFAELAALKAGEGARQLIANQASKVVTIYFPQGAFDVDTPLDYERLVNI